MSQMINRNFGRNRFQNTSNNANTKDLQPVKNKAILPSVEKRGFQNYSKQNNFGEDQQFGVTQNNKGSQNNPISLEDENNQQILKNLCIQQELTYYTFQEQEKQQSYDFLILKENELFYCKSDSFKKIENNRIQLQGKRYLTQLDNNFNPKYQIQEGNFSVNSTLKDFKFLHGIVYLGKSNQIKPQEKFENQLQQGEQNKTKSSQFRCQSLAPPKIIIREYGIIVNNNRNAQISRVNQKVWCKYNQQLNERDEQILKSKWWLTSSIIDSFVFYLNLESEKHYFEKGLGQRKQIKRTLFLPTTLTTSFGNSYDYKKAENLYQQELLQFQEMNFEIKNIYKKIGFPINKSNYHWQFVLFDYEDNTVQLFDSFNYQFNKQLIETLRKLINFNQNYKEIQNNEFGQQRNNYACGYYVCTFMLYFYELQFSQFQQPQKIYNEEKIIKILQQIIKNKEDQ